MKPEEFRTLLIDPSTKIGLIGDYNAPSTWSHDEQVIATLEAYLVVERRLLFGQGISWDTVAIASLPTPLQTVSLESEECVVSALLLMHRHTKTEGEGSVTRAKYFPPWENERIVLVYGVRIGESLEPGPLPLEAWQSKTVWLSSAAMLTIEDPLNPSPLAQVLQRRKEMRELREKLDTGLITRQEYEAKKASILTEQDKQGWGSKY